MYVQFNAISLVSSLGLSTSQNLSLSFAGIDQLPFETT
jgi:hypothetical protein